MRQASNQANGFDSDIAVGRVTLSNSMKKSLPGRQAFSLWAL